MLRHAAVEISFCQLSFLATKLQILLGKLISRLALIKQFP
ncbi:hypothetical protein C8R31_10179 [Nitrosospira sp. Nsp2]|nr:hypothetical protein C8R31_10179 [Nitrosospira sp. Nsp2]